MFDFWKAKKRRREAIESDIAEAQRVREEERNTQLALASGVAFLVRRRDTNGFGDDLEVTFTPRRHGAA